MGRIVGLNTQEGEEREEHDFYATHPSSIPPLLKLLGWENGGKVVWENSCGQGHLSKEIEKAGHTVISSDLINRGYGIHGIDFTKGSWLDLMRYDGIIMNPPYKYSQLFIEKSLTIAPVVCAFLRLTFLESSRRTEFFRLNPPKTIAVFRKRVPSAKDGNFDSYKSGAVAYAWFIWEKGYTGKPVVEWI